MFKLSVIQPKWLIVGFFITFNQVSFAAENPLETMMKAGKDAAQKSMEIAQDAAQKSKDALQGAAKKASEDAKAAAAKLPSFSIDKLTQDGEPSEPSKDFQWTKELVQMVKEGDAKRGEELAKKGKCARCHEDTGVSEDDDTPSIAGQIVAYSVKQLHDYKVGLRESRDMRKPVKNLSQKDMVDLSTYFAAQTPEKKHGTKSPVLADVGDKERFLLACNSCHNEDSMRRGYQTPILEGQKIGYFIETMVAFKEGDRVNDHYSLMRGLSEKLTEEEITELAEYYSAKPSEDD